MSNYAETVYQAAKAAGKTSQFIASRDYRGIAAFSGVVIESNGNSPADFWWKAIRNHVVSRLRTEEEETESFAKGELFRSTLQELVAAQGLTVIIDRNGFRDYRVRLTDGS